MRFFWIAILLLCVAAAGAFYMRREKATPVQPTPLTLPAESIPAPEPKPTPAPTPVATTLPIAPPTPTTPTSVPTPAPAPTATAIATTSTPEPTPAAPPARLVPPQPEPTLPPAAKTDKPDPQLTVVTAPDMRPIPTPSPTPEHTTGITVTPPSTPPAAVVPPKAEAPIPAVAATPKTQEKPAPSPAPASTETSTDIANGLANLVGDGSTKSAESTAPSIPTIAPPPTPAAPAPAKIKLEPQPDGTTLVDEKYVMKGKGTKDDPYRVTWEQLLSAQDTYQPRLGRKQIPERVKMLDGKWVRVNGYIAFPLMAASADEMLMMLNQWDGCCIGVPPTPYDAIEVKLKTAAKGDARLRTTGTLTGILRVDPYLVKDWLVSLYVMDDGEVSDTAGTTAQGQHAK